jgi:hypothetical protein
MRSKYGDTCHSLYATGRVYLDDNPMDIGRDVFYQVTDFH